MGGVDYAHARAVCTRSSFLRRPRKEPGDEAMLGQAESANYSYSELSYASAKLYRSIVYRLTVHCTGRDFVEVLGS